MTDPAREHEVEEQESAKKPGKGCGCGCSSGCLTVLAVLAVLLGLAVMSVPLVARHYARKGLSPADLQEMNDLRNKPVDFPREWADVKPFSPELKAQMEKVELAASAVPTTVTLHFTDYQSSVGNALVEFIHNTPLSEPETMTTITKMAKLGDAYLHEIAEIVSLPDYEVDALDGLPDTFTTFRGHTIVSFNQLRWLTVAKVVERLEAGDCLAAADLALIPLRAARAHPTDVQSHNLSQYVYMSSHLAQLVSEHCETTESLKLLLDDMNGLEVAIPWHTDHSPELVEVISKLRSFKREGYPAELEPGKPALHYMLAAFEADIGLFAEHMAKTLPITDPRRAEYQRSVDQWSRMFGGAIRVRPVHMVQAAQLLAPDIAARIILEHGRHKPAIMPARAYYDIARLNIAHRLATLVDDANSTDSKSLVPRYLPKEPICPYSGKPYLWDETTQQYYSVGPDGTDNYLKDHVEFQSVRYSSAVTGDIAIPAPLNHHGAQTPVYY